MQELRFVAVSEDGSYAVLAVPGRSARFTLPIDERLRAVALGQTSRLAQYEIEVESPLRPKEIQARIRAGETAEEIADAAGIPVERVRWFEGPVLAERAYIAQQAQAASVRRPGDSSGPGARLADIVPSRLKAAGADPDDGQWDARKRGDGNWQVTLTFTAAGRLHVAEWMFDPRRRHVLPEDDNAARLSLPDAELPPLSAPMPGEATVTPLAPRLGAVSAGGMGGGPVGGPPRLAAARRAVPVPAAAGSAPSARRSRSARLSPNDPVSPNGPRRLSARRCRTPRPRPRRSPARRTGTRCPNGRPSRPVPLPMIPNDPGRLPSARSSSRSRTRPRSTSSPHQSRNQWRQHPRQSRPPRQTRNPPPRSLPHAPARARRTPAAAARRSRPGTRSCSAAPGRRTSQRPGARPMSGYSPFLAVISLTDGVRLPREWRPGDLFLFSVVRTAENRNKSDRPKRYAAPL